MLQNAMRPVSGRYNLVGRLMINREAVLKPNQEGVATSSRLELSAFRRFHTWGCQSIVVVDHSQLHRIT